MIRARALALAATLAGSTSAATAAVEDWSADRVQAGTVMIGVQEASDVLLPLYRLPGQEPTWFRRLVHRLFYGTAELDRNPYAGIYMETGAGALVGPDRVLTAAHIVISSQRYRDGTTLWLRFRDGRQTLAKLEAIAPNYDAAVLRFNLDQEQPRPLPIAHNEGQQIGAKVMIAGAPKGHSWWMEWGTARSLGMVAYDASYTKGLRQYSWIIEGKATNGNSGGPVANEDGELVAIVSSAHDRPGTFVAVPAATALQNIEFWQRENPARTRLECLNRKGHTR